MSELDVEEAAQAPAPRQAPQVQKVNLSSRGEVTIPEGDERVANLVRMGLSEVEARAAVATVAMW